MFRRIAQIVAHISVSLGLISTLFAASPPGYYVNGRFLYDPCGQKTVLIGVNAQIVYIDREGTKDYPEIAKTGANCCRIMWMWNYPTPTAAEFDSTLQHCYTNRMIPIPGVWAATGNWSNFQQCVDYWCSDTISAVIKKHQQHMILNIANEPGDAVIPDDQFRTYYKNAVTQIRAAGIHTPLLCDATSWGRDENSVINNGAYLVNQDPDHNLLFAWHLYDPITWTGSPTRIKSAIDRSITENICMIVGEFGFSENGTVGTGSDIAWQYTVNYANQNQVGWLPWDWRGDNLNMTADSTYAHLTTWGQAIGDSIKNNAVRTTFLTSGTACSNVAAHFTATPTSGAIPLTVNFNGSTSTGTNLKYSWTFGDGGGATGTSAGTYATTSHIYTLAGTYKVKLTVNDGSTSSSDSSTITATDPTQEPAVRIINDSTMGSGINHFNFSGSWTVAADEAYDGDEHWTSTTGSFYSIAFYGAQIKLFGTKDAHHGIATVSIDGGTPVDVDFYAATRAAISLLWTSPALTKGNHSITVTNSGRKNAASSGTVIVGDRADIYQSAGGSTRLIRAIPWSSFGTKGNGVSMSDGIVELTDIRGCRITAGASPIRRSPGIYIARISNKNGLLFQVKTNQTRLSTRSLP